MEYTNQQNQTENEMTSAVSLVVDRLLGMAATDPQMAFGLRHFAKRLLSIVGDDAIRSSPVVDDAPAVPVVVADVPSDLAKLAHQKDVIEPASVPVLTFPHAPSRTDDAADYSDYEQSEIDFSLVEQRARLKAQGCSWRAKRLELIANEAGIINVDSEGRELVQHAKALPNCLLWMLRRCGSAPCDATAWNDLAGCFTTMADAVALVRGVVEAADEDTGMLDEGLQLLAEAQSAVRIGVERLGLGPDRDQHQAYVWLRQSAVKNQKYIGRFMRIDDPADPSLWSDLAQRIDILKGRFEGDRVQRRRLKAGIGKVKFHAGRIARQADVRADWQAIIDAVTELIKEGLPASNPELRQLLLPIVDGLPDLELPRQFRLVLDEIDRYLASRPEEEDIQDVATTPEVVAVAKLLVGKAVVLIGGNRRPKAHSALKSALGVELDWIETRDHESVATFEPNIARPDVAVVIVAIRWSSHSFGEVRRFCEKYGKPLVRLPAGYNANQVAFQIKNQCGDRLAAAKAAEGG